MARRTYNQYCPLAHGLDLVGERWTLLIVRDLALGPRRFSDLLRGLPGIGPNLLSRRLKSMEAAGIVAQVFLPSPVRVNAYGLTPSGEALAEAMGALATWGLQHMPPPVPDEEFVGAIQAMSALRLLFQPKIADDESIQAEVLLDPDSFQVHLRGTELSIEQGLFPQAELSLRTDPKSLVRLAAGQLAADQAQDACLLGLVRGTEAMADRFFAQFMRPSGVKTVVSAQTP